MRYLSRSEAERFLKIEMDYNPRAVQDYINARRDDSSFFDVRTKDEILDDFTSWLDIQNSEE